ncbi:MAG: acyl-[Spirochaetaceae bacterium]|nr:acyl-[acyl-carrier-protein] thioesterase [Spirochaetaceae bacterium]
MVSFRQYHDEKMAFHREMKLSFSQCDQFHRLKLSELLAITSDAAVEDFNERGLSWKFLAEHDTAILLSRLAFRIHKMPKTNDIIAVHTWEEAPQGLQLFRKYEITGKDGKKLVSGTSSWLVVNPATRRIIKPANFTLREAPGFTTPLNTLECGKIQQDENAVFLEERKVRPSDLDGNGHVNNSRYGDYITDCLSEEQLSRQLKDFRLNYAKEATSGQTLQLFASEDKAQNTITITGKQEQNVCFESVLYF